MHEYTASISGCLLQAFYRRRVQNFLSFSFGRGGGGGGRRWKWGWGEETVIFAIVTHWPRCITFVFERKSEISNANWFLTNQNRVWFVWFAFKRKFYATEPLWRHWYVVHIKLCNEVYTVNSTLVESIGTEEINLTLIEKIRFRPMGGKKTTPKRK